MAGRIALTVELLVMGVIASSFFIYGSDPRVVCLMATLYPPGYVTQRESGTVLFSAAQTVQIWLKNNPHQHSPKPL